MTDNDKKWLLTPKSQVPVTGQLIPKDIHYRIKFKDRPKYRFSLCMPDGMICSISVFEGEDPDKKIKEFIDNWYKVTKENPMLFDHFLIKQKCPNCGGELWAKILEKGCAIWCINYPHCNYMDYGDSEKARQLMAEKYGLKWKLVHKEGASVIFFNRNNNIKK